MKHAASSHWRRLKSKFLAISGIAAFVRWNDISLTIPTNSLTGANEWNVMDDIFGAVAQWNANNPDTIPKTIQLCLLPGFWTRRPHKRSRVSFGGC